MEKKSDTEIFLEYIPVYTIWYKTLLLYLYHFIIFIIIFVLFWWVSSNYILITPIFQIIIALGANIPFILMFSKIDKIREKYNNKKNGRSWFHFFIHYSYTSPLGATIFYTPLLLITYEQPFLQLIDMPSYIFTSSLFPIYITIPFSLFFIILGIRIASVAQEYDGDMQSYLYVMCPNRIKPYKKGVYQFIRHPRFLCRFIIAFGIGIIANNLLAIGIVIIHFIPYLIWMEVLDTEIIRIYGNRIKIYQKEVPSLIPKYKNWYNIFKLLLKSS